MAQLKKESPGMYKELVANGMIGSEGFNIPDVVEKTTQVSELQKLAKYMADTQPR